MRIRRSACRTDRLADGVREPDSSRRRGCDARRRRGVVPSYGPPAQDGHRDDGAFARIPVAVLGLAADRVRGETAERDEAARRDLEVPAQEGRRRPRAGRQHASAQAGFCGADRRLVPRRAEGLSCRSHPERSLQRARALQAGCRAQDFRRSSTRGPRLRASSLGVADARVVVPFFHGRRDADVAGEPRRHLPVVDRLGLHLARAPGDHVAPGGERASRAVRREHRRPAGALVGSCRD